MRCGQARLWDAPGRSWRAAGRRWAGRWWGKVGGSRPISRVLSWATIHLERASPRASSDLPGSLCGPQLPAEASALPYLVLLQAGFAVPSSVATDAVRSYRTVSPLPSAHFCAAWAVCFLLHFPWACAPQALPGASSCGARTFLCKLRSGCLADSRGDYTGPPQSRRPYPSRYAILARMAARIPAPENHRSPSTLWRLAVTLGLALVAQTSGALGPRLLRGLAMAAVGLVLWLVDVFAELIDPRDALPADPAMIPARPQPQQKR